LRSHLRVPAARSLPPRCAPSLHDALPILTVAQNIGFGLKTRGLSKEARKDPVRALIDQMSLQGFESAYPSELSGGMQQRVAIARSEEHTSELQSRFDLVCRLLLEKKTADR